MSAKKKKKPVTREMMNIANEKLFKHLEEQNFGSIEEINEYLNENFNGKRLDDVFLDNKENLSNEDKADELMYQAYDSDDKAGLKLAKEALKIDPENVRALNFVGELQDNEDKAYEYFKKAVEIGAKKLGPEYFTKDKGHFWGLIETRPYMEARLNYAMSLCNKNKTDEGIKELWEMLELNPNDNQGVRHVLASILLYHRKYNGFYRLYQQHKKEQTTNWLFNYALFLYATEGPGKKADKALLIADKANKHVLPFMTGRKKITNEPDGTYTHGDEDEAAYYLMDFFASWKELNGILEWVMEVKYY